MHVHKIKIAELGFNFQHPSALPPEHSSSNEWNVLHTHTQKNLQAPCIPEICLGQFSQVFPRRETVNDEVMGEANVKPNCPPSGLP